MPELKYTYHTRLEDIVPHVPASKKGVYRGYSIVVLGGSSYSVESLDRFQPQDESTYFPNIKKECAYPNINFMKRLSAATTTFTFERPTDLINANLYGGADHRHLYVASKTDLTIKKYGMFIDRMLQHHGVRGPYVFVGLSEGSYDALCYRRLRPGAVAGLCFVDSPYLERHILAFERLRGNLWWYEKLARGEYSWDARRRPAEADWRDVDAYNFEMKTQNIITRLRVADVPPGAVVLWSPYFASQRRRDRRMMAVQDALSAEYMARGVRVERRDAPHQMERVIPLSLAQLITSLVSSQTKKK